MAFILRWFCFVKNVQRPLAKGLMMVFYQQYVLQPESRPPHLLGHSFKFHTPVNMTDPKAFGGSITLACGQVREGVHCSVCSLGVESALQLAQCLHYLISEQPARQAGQECLFPFLQGRLREVTEPATSHVPGKSASHLWSRLEAR